jgi:hypothetical protein
MSALTGSTGRESITTHERIANAEARRFMVSPLNIRCSI